MELTNFGSIMKFAIEQEEVFSSALEQAAANEKLSPLNAAIASLKEQNANNRKLLERTRREGICEMVLHPIEGLCADEHQFSAAGVDAMTAEEFRTFVEGAAGKLAAFYAAAAEKLPADDAKRAFQRLAKKRYGVEG